MQLNVSPEISTLCEKALAISVRSGRTFVGVEDLFAAVLDSPDQLPQAVHERWLNNLFTVMRETRRTAWSGSLPVSAVGEPFYTPRAIAALQKAQSLVTQHGGHAGGAHLLAALLADSLSQPARIMDAFGLERSACLAALMRALGEPAAPGAVPQAHAATAQPVPVPAEAPGNDARQTPPPQDRLVRDLSDAARRGDLRQAVGRDAEIFQVLQVLARKTKNSVMLVGEAGVGKTQVVEGLAVQLAERNNGQMPDYRILELNVGALLSGTQYRGAFEEKVLHLIDEVKHSEDAVLFIDEAHLIMGAGATEGDAVDLANLLKPVLARGEIRCIAATTVREYRKFVEKDPAIERRFQMVRVEELSEADTLRVLERLQCTLEKHHRVRISSRALKSAVDLTVRYMPNLNLPDKAIDVLDQACARHQLKRLAASSGGAADITMPPVEQHVVTPHDVRKVVSQVTAIPVEEMTAEERMRLNDLDRQLARRLIGQDEAVARTVSAVKKARAGLADPNRPDAVLLFLGPTGVGKTELAKLLALYLFGSENHLQRFDMTEYAESHDVSRLLGAAPGYAGSEEEGQLAAAVRRMPFSILLFDEMEKAHPRIFDVFLPIFDEGVIRSNQGRTVSFKNCIMIMTSNVGAELLSRGPGDDEKLLMTELRRYFRPEFINRIDAVIPFYPLLAEDIRSILRLEVERLRSRLRDRRVGVRMYQRAYEHLASEGYSPEFGARELRRVFEKRVVEPIGELLLAEDFAPGDMLDVKMEHGALEISRGRPHSAVDTAAP